MMAVKVRAICGALAVVALAVVVAGLLRGGEMTPSPAAADAALPVRTIDPKSFCVMAANIRLPESEDTGSAAWAQRRELLVRTIFAHSPDIVGFQEDSPAQQLYLIPQLKGYAHVPRENSPAKDNQKPDGSGILAPLADLMQGLNTLYYRKDRFELLSWANGPLRPDVLQDSVSENTFYTLAVLSDKSKVFPDLIVLDTHLRHGSANAIICAENIHVILAEQLKAHPGGQAIVLGDMNHDRTEKVYTALIGDGSKEAPELVDAFDYTQKKPGEKWGTWHAFVGKSNRDWPTDLILLTKGLSCDPTVIVRDHEEDGSTGKWPSDHFFVKTVFRTHK